MGATTRAAHHMPYASRRYGHLRGNYGGRRYTGVYTAMAGVVGAGGRVTWRSIGYKVPDDVMVVTVVFAAGKFGAANRWRQIGCHFFLSKPFSGPSLAGAKRGASYGVSE